MKNLTHTNAIQVGSQNECNSFDSPIGFNILKILQIRHDSDIYSYIRVA